MARASRLIVFRPRPLRQGFNASQRIMGRVALPLAAGSAIEMASRRAWTQISISTSVSG